MFIKFLRNIQIFFIWANTVTLTDRKYTQISWYMIPICIHSCTMYRLQHIYICFRKNIQLPEEKGSLAFYLFTKKYNLQLLSCCLEFYFCVLTFFIRLSSRVVAAAWRWNTPTPTTTPSQLYPSLYPKTSPSCVSCKQPSHSANTFRCPPPPVTSQPPFRRTCCQGRTMLLAAFDWLTRPYLAPTLWHWPHPLSSSKLVSACASGTLCSFHMCYCLAKRLFCH